MITSGSLLQHSGTLEYNSEFDEDALARQFSKKLGFKSIGDGVVTTTSSTASSSDTNFFGYHEFYQHPIQLDSYQNFSASSSPHRVATTAALRAISSPGSFPGEAEYYNADLHRTTNTIQYNNNLLAVPEYMGYSAIPPQGYMCKLCFVPGHWLRNCNLYLERKRGNQLHQQLMSELNNNPANALISPEVKLQYEKLSQQLYLGASNMNRGMMMGGCGSSTTAPKTIPPDGYICRKCNTPGHWIQQCPFQKTSIPPATYTCRICGVKGHWIYQCAYRVLKPIGPPPTIVVPSSSGSSSMLMPERLHHSTAVPSSLFSTSSSGFNLGNGFSSSYHHHVGFNVESFGPR